MRPKLYVTALYGLVLLATVASSIRSFALTDSAAPQPQAEFAKIRLDERGRRGVVFFDHKLHEAEVNPDPNFPHKPVGNLACVGCHHTVRAEDVTRTVVRDGRPVNQFEKCSTCHRPESTPEAPCDPTGRQANPCDPQGIELTGQEALHRLCIGCHRAQPAGRRFTTTDPRFRAVSTNIRFDKCDQCHNSEIRGEIGPIATRLNEPPPADDATEGILRPRRLPPAATGPPPELPFEPPGYAGASRIPAPEPGSADTLPTPDRWRMGFPDDPRIKEGRFRNPYHQNVLKGDYPIFRQHNFLVLTLESETFAAARRIPIPSNVSAQRPDSEEFFGRGGQIFVRQNLVTSFELFHGDTSFKPIDWRFRFTPNFNFTYLNTKENSIVNISPLFGSNRYDSYIGFQELFGEVRLGDTTKLIPFLRGRGSQGGESPYFDTTFLRAGVQQFQSDFRGFVFNDFNLAARIFGQAANNRYNYNLAYFYMLEKDTNSELTTRINLGELRNQTVLIANLYRQDTFRKGFTAQFSFHYNNDRPSREFDINNFLVRPALIGDAAEHGIKAAYVGVAGDGHLGLNNISAAFYQVFGRDSRNPIAGRRTSINAQMAAVEYSRDRDWFRYKASFFFASGDKQPFDGKARGFDSILDFTEFAGGINSFWQSVPIPFGNTAVLLTSPGSLLPSLRSSKIQGQANFVNPGILIYNVGSELELAPKLRAILNLNYMHFHHTESLEETLFQPGIRRDIGFDYGIGFLYRPLLSENWIVAAGFNSLIPGSGFREIFSSNCSGSNCGFRTNALYNFYVKVKFTY